MTALPFIAVMTLPIDTSSMQSDRAPSCWRCWSAWIPSLALWILSLSPVAVILLCDAGLAYAIFLFRQVVFSGSFAGAFWELLLESSSNWIRTALVSLAFVFWCGCLYLAIGGRRCWRPQPGMKPASTDRMLVTGAVYVVSLAVLLTQAPTLVEYGAYWRVCRMEGRLRLVGQSLFEEWPTVSGKHPLLRKIVGASRRDPNLVFVSGYESLNFADELGPTFERNAAGTAILLELDSNQLAGRENVVIALRSPDVIPDEELLRKRRFHWSRCWRIAPDLYFAR